MGVAPFKKGRDALLFKTSASLAADGWKKTKSNNKKQIINHFRREEEIKRKWN